MRAALALRLATTFALLALCVSPPCNTAEAQTTAQSSTLTKADFVLELVEQATLGGASDDRVLGKTELETYFNRARCQCAAAVLARVQLTDEGRKRLAEADDEITAELMLGDDCNDAESDDGCKSLGTGTLDGSTSKLEATLAATELFRPFASEGDACRTTGTKTRTLWAVLRQDGERLKDPPSLSLRLRGTGPTAPALSRAEPGDGSLVASWEKPADTSGLRGFQLVCTPAPVRAAAAGYDVCDGAANAVDAANVCSELVGPDAKAARAMGLTNGTTYAVRIVAIDEFGNASAPSEPVTGTPGPTVGFYDLYEQAAGQPEGGCSVGRGARGARCPLNVVGVPIAALLLLRRGRRRRALAAGGLALSFGAVTYADDSVVDVRATSATEPARVGSPESGALTLRLGPYRPEIDRALAARGATTRPFASAFGSEKPLLFAAELERHVLRTSWATLAASGGVGYLRASGRALRADGAGPSADETSLRIVPLSASAVLRLDGWTRSGGWLAPYAKLGLDHALWSASRSGAKSASGGTSGWHATAGLALLVDAFDPSSATTLDQETGLNHTYVFFEVTRTSLDGFGDEGRMPLSETHWSAGLTLTF